MHLNHKKKSKEEIFSVIGLLVVAICWGFGFLGLRYVDGLPTFYVQAIRFGIAALALAAVFFKHLKNVDKELLKAGILIGILMFACYAWHQIYDSFENCFLLHARCNLRTAS